MSYLDSTSLHKRSRLLSWMQISAVLITTMMETLLFIVAVHGVVVGVSRWMSWPLGSYFRASTLEMGRKSCLLASRGMGGSGLKRIIARR